MPMKHKDTTSAPMIKRCLLAGWLRIVCSLVRVIFCFIRRPFLQQQTLSAEEAPERLQHVLAGCSVARRVRSLYFPLIYDVQLLHNTRSPCVQGCCKVHQTISSPGTGFIAPCSFQRNGIWFGCRLATVVLGSTILFVNDGEHASHASCSREEIPVY